MMIKFYTIATNSFMDAKNSVSAQLRKLAAEESGATAIEYSLIAAGIAVAIIAVVFTLGTDLAALFESIDEKINSSKPCEQAHANCGNG